MKKQVKRLIHVFLYLNGRIDWNCTNSVLSDDGNKVLERTIPVKKVMTEEGEVFVTTVYDLTLANYGVNRGLGGQEQKDFNDDVPFTPAWQEKITGVKRELIIQIAREFAQNAVDTNGRSMIIVGAGINHWFNSDTIYRAVLNLVLLVSVNGGGWAHYVGQEKLRPAEGWQTIAMAKDWQYHRNYKMVRFSSIS